MCFATKRTGKKRIEENANVSILEKDNQACNVVLRSVIHSLCELLNFYLSRSVVTLE